MIQVTATRQYKSSKVTPAHSRAYKFVPWEKPNQMGYFIPITLLNSNILMFLYIQLQYTTHT